MIATRSRGTWLVLIACLGIWQGAVADVRAAEPAAKIYVVLWFDTEDYLLPASDDAALRLADALTKQKIRATFKVVGEKARTLEKRERADVIAALKKHEIGYHSNFHSVQPTPAVYLANLGWDEGVAEFDRRERPGYDAVKRLFGMAPSCYGQPGSSWAPQAYGAMKNWGMDVYLDGGKHLAVDERPHFYCGLLTLYHLAHVIHIGPAEKLMKQAEEKFLTARQKLLEEGGGVVSIYSHPCEFAHQEFWDGVNFRQGANPPREQWKLPRAKSPEEMKAGFEQFENYLRFLQRFPEVRFVTASEAARIYRDRARGRTFSVAELKALAAATSASVTFLKRDDYTLSAGEVFALLTTYVAESSAGRAPAELVLKDSPLGPTSQVVALAEPVTIESAQFVRTAADVQDFLSKHGRLPAAVWLGSGAVPPEAYLQALAFVAVDLMDGKPMPKSITIKPAQLAAARHVADDSPDLWRWVIFPPGFRAPAMMDLARRQAWTLKPALRERPAP